MKKEEKSKVEKAWEYLSGKKTFIGLSLHAAWLAAGIIFETDIPESKALLGHTIIFQITGVGIGHKIFKFFKK